MLPKTASKTTIIKITERKQGELKRAPFSLARR
jgi:hypothetical protein